MPVIKYLPMDIKEQSINQSINQSTNQLLSYTEPKKNNLIMLFCVQQTFNIFNKFVTKISLKKIKNLGRQNAIFKPFNAWAL